jgi:DNA-binding CsgD family transcriptional regulator
MKDDLLVISSFKNAKLYQLLEESLLSRRELCKLLKISYVTLSGVLTLRLSPYTPRGCHSQLCQKVADYFWLEFEELFPASLYKLRLPNQSFHRYDSLAVLPLLEARRQHLLPEFTESTVYDDFRQGELRDQIKNILRTLTPREEKIARLFWGLDGEPAMTISELADFFSLCRGRIDQIVAKILAKLRHPSRAHKLREYVSEEDRI